MLKDGVDGVDGLSGAWSVTVSPDGANVYVAAYDRSNYDHAVSAVSIFSRDTLNQGRLSYVRLLQDGVGGVDGLSRATSVTVSPD
jgi:fibronectin-binding autotransporter adhesin